jgi:diadenosine tetraphosphate (Ap4A) HIT family hydrolase/5-methylcytosine-specific restriction endonuclease McrA
VRFEDLADFIERGMRMSHVYQPVMLRALLDGGGRAGRVEIARALLNQDQSQLEYYSAITSNMVGRVLVNRGIVERDGGTYRLIGYDELTPGQARRLSELCEKKLGEYVARRGAAIWEHRRRSAGYVSGTVRYEILKRAKFRCDLCGVSADEKALEVDHIVPRNKSGTDDPSNLQALCYSCNAMKRDRDDTDFSAVRAAYSHRESGCPFCDLGDREVLLQNNLAFVLRDLYPVSAGHALIIPKRHTADYFDLGPGELQACHRLVSEARSLLLNQYDSIAGFNVGVNGGQAAGQTVMHCHIHLIPRRRGDQLNPRGGVRGVIPGRADYTSGR